MEGILGRENRASSTGGAVEAALAEPEGRILRGLERRGRRRDVRGSAGIGVASGRRMPATTRSGPPKRATWPWKTGGPSGSRRSFGAEDATGSRARRGCSPLKTKNVSCRRRSDVPSVPRAAGFERSSLVSGRT